MWDVKNLVQFYKWVVESYTAVYSFSMNTKHEQYVSLVIVQNSIRTAIFIVSTIFLYSVF